MNRLKRLGAALMCLSMSLSVCPWTYASSVQITETNIVDDVIEDDSNTSVVSSLTDDDADNAIPDDVLNNDNLSPGGGRVRCIGR